MSCAGFLASHRCIHLYIAVAYVGGEAANPFGCDVSEEKHDRDIITSIRRNH